MSQPACLHRTLENSVQEFVLTEISRRAVEELFDLTEKKLGTTDNTTESDVLRPVLIDSSIGIQPLNHSLHRLRTLMSRFPARRGGRVAIILPPNALTRTLFMMMRPIVPVRIYMPHEREAALAWLVESVESAQR